MNITFPYPVDKAVITKAANVKLALFDVDGVLTDGSLTYASDGETVKVFNALDGHGLKMLQQANIQVGIITARESDALKRRMSDLGIQHCYYGVNNKITTFENLLSKLSIDETQCCYTGDDVIDLPVMQRCGLSFSVNNGHYIVQQAADWVSPLQGGNGAARTICDLLLTSQDCYPLDFFSSQ